jgi:O-antigen/teichoic acid export membrane protein
VNKIINFIKQIDTVRSFQIFQVLRFLTILITGILLAKSKMNIRDIGSYESLIFFSGAVSFFWVSGLLNGLLSSYNKSIQEGNNTLLFNTACSLYLLNSILLIFLLIFHQTAQRLLPDEAIDYYPLMLLYIFLNNPTFLIEHLLLLTNKSIGLLKYGVINLIAYVSAVAIPVYLGYGLEYSFYGLIVLAAIKNIILHRLLTGCSQLQINFKIIFDQILFSLPLIFSLLISGSAEYVDGLLVSTHFGSDAFAIFRYGAKELPLAVLLSGAISNALVPKLAASRFDKTGLNQLKKESARLMHLLYPITIVLLLTSNYFYPLVFREEFSSSAVIFNTYLLLLISRVVFPQTLVIAAGKNNFIFKIALVEITVNVLVSYVLMLKLGIIGIAIGTLAAFIVEKCCLALYVHIKMKIPISEYLQWKTWLFYSCLLVTVFFFHYFSTHH